MVEDIDFEYPEWRKDQVFVRKLPSDTVLKNKLSEYRKYLKPEQYQERAIHTNMLQMYLVLELQVKEAIVFHREQIRKIDVE